MRKYNTTEAIREAIHSLEEGDIIKVPQYTNALEIEHLGELNGEKNAFVGVRFADPHKRTSAVKTIILNKHSGIAHLSAGTTSKGIVSELEVRKPTPVGTLVTEEDEDEAEPEPESEPEAPEPDAFGHSELIEIERPVEFLVSREAVDEVPTEYVDLEQYEPRRAVERELTFEEEYREEVEHLAAVIIDEIEADMGEDFEHVTRSDLPEVADREVGEELYFHEYTNESANYLKVIEASPSDPDACVWQDYVNFEDSPDADDIHGAMSYVLFREDIRDALRGEW